MVLQSMARTFKIFRLHSRQSRGSFQNDFAAVALSSSEALKSITKTP